MSGRRADEIFQMALDFPPGEREEFCRAQCGDDPELLDEVLSLLHHDPGTGAAPFGEAPMRLGPAGRQLDDPERIGKFRILQRLGVGGFGVVYEAEQQEPIRRRIALKVLKAGMDTEEVLARFDAERQALALMDHHNIARVLDVGATEQGRPWFAMELVRGEPITQYADTARLDVDQRIELFLKVCRAVQHAHQKGILHRDLKPSNILVTRMDGVATPKIIDFGIAKAVTTPLVDRTLRTISGSLMGTPAYMSPEQAGTSRLDVDTSTDVYSLGVILYELLCGVLPVDVEALDQSNPTEIASRLREAKRRPPSDRMSKADADQTRLASLRRTDPWTLRARLRNDLDWITMKAIATDRERRYQTVQELEQELLRHRANEPVKAGPPGVRYRMAKFARRHRAELAVAGVILVILLGSGAALTWALVDANRQRESALVARTEALSARAESEVVVQFLSDMLAAPRPVAEGRDVTVAEVLDQATSTGGLEFPDQPNVEARLRTVIGSTYRELGRTEEARTQLEKALSMQERELGPDHPATLETERALGLVFREMGEYETALPHLERAVEGLRRIDPPDSLALVRALECLGSVWLMDEKPARALDYLQEAWPIAERHMEPTDEVYGSLVSDLGLSFASLGEYGKAEPFLERSYRIDLEHWGADHARTMISSQNLGSFYREIGKIDEAIPLYEQAYRSSVANYGPEHPSTVRTRSNLALALSDAGRFDEALEPSEWVVRIRERDLGATASPTLASRINLALLYHRLERDAEAEAHIRDTLARCRRELGHDHLYSLICEGLLGEILVTEGRAVEAERLLRDTVARLASTRGEAYWRTAHVRVTWGLALAGIGESARAKAEMERARRDLLESFDATHHRVVRADEALASLQ